MRNAKKFKWLALALAASMFAGSLVGCGGTENSDEEPTGQGSEEPGGEEPAGEDSAEGQFDVTLKIVFPGDEPPDQDAVNEAVSKKMAEDGLGNFKFEYTFIPWDQYWNRLSMIRAGEEDYDIMWQHSEYIRSAIAGGLVANLSPSLEKYGQGLLSYIPDYAWSGSALDGNYYAIPRVVPNAQYDWVLSIRGDLRKKYGLPELKTIDDVETYFQTIKDNEPDIAPTGYIPFREVFYREYIPSWYLPTQSVAVDLEDPEFKVINFFASDEFAEMAAKSEEFRQKGFYYPDYGTQYAHETGFMAGLCAACFGNTMWPTERIDTLVTNVPGAEIETVFVNPELPKYMTATSDNLFAVFEHSKNIDAAVAFINWIHESQENYDLITYGIEGVNYNLDGESVSIEGIEQENLYQPISWVWTDLRYNRYSKNLDPSYVDFINTWDDDAVETKLIGFAFDPSSVQTEVANIATVYDTYIAPVVAEGTAAFDRDTVIKELEAAGIDKVMAAVQEQIDAYVAEQN